MGLPVVVKLLSMPLPAFELFQGAVGPTGAVGEVGDAGGVVRIAMYLR